MKVYMLSYGQYSDYTILGVYSTREKAEAEKKVFDTPEDIRWNEGAEVKEIELDTRLEPGMFDSRSK